jgi:hypothetical protein
MAETKPKRSRKSHPKTRTGCLTCKIRRKKCGEEKPACLRCTSTGRKCDGYPVLKTHGLPSPATSPEDAVDHWADLEQSSNAAIFVQKRTDFGLDLFDAPGYAFDQQISSEREQLDPSPPSFLSIDRHHNHALSTPCALSELEYHVPLTLQPTISPFATQKEFYCFDFFCRQTNPLFTHYFETTMWAGPMMQACFQPAVQQAMIALGAVHRRYELGITPEAFEYCAFSMKAYSKAMASTRDLLATGGPQMAELTIILSWLFGAFEVFQGNDEAACQHLKSGLKAFFAQKFKKQESRTVRRNISLNEENVRKFFRKLELKSDEIFGEPARILCKPGDMSELPEVPEHFYSLDHARDVVFTQIHWNFWALSQGENDDCNRPTSLSDRVARLLQWSVSYAKLCKSLTTRKSPCQGSRQAASCLLRVCRELSYIILLLQPATTREYEVEKFCSLHAKVPDEAQRVDTMNNHFAKLLIMSDRLLNSDVWVFEKSLKRPSFGVDSGIQPPLYLAATRCRSAKLRVRSTKIRHQAQSLLKDTPREAKMRHALGAYNVAERTSMLEEEAALSCGALPAEIAGKARWIDLTCYLEERKVLRSYCIPEEGTGVDGLVWVQEWITF